MHHPIQARIADATAPRLVLALFMLCTLAVTACESTDQTEPSVADDSGAVSDAEVLDAARDRGDDVSDTSFDLVEDAVDASDADTADASDAADADTGRFEATCDCPGGELECEISGSEIRCVQTATSTCQDEGCPEGFVCADDGRCVCDSSERGDACRPECGPREACPEAFVCNDEGFCEAPEGCESQYECDDGLWCIENSRFGTSVCTPPGEKSAGSACERDEACRSGKCNGFCRRRCLTEGDCRSGERCRSTGAYCEERTCRASCDEGQVCDGDDCRGRICWGSDDCSNGDCLAQPAGHPHDDYNGHCAEDGPKYCKPGEFRTTSDDPFCRIPVSCGRGDCPAGYYCVVNNAKTYQYKAKWCSRRIAPWPWPPE